MSAQVVRKWFNIQNYHFLTYNNIIISKYKQRQVKINIDIYHALTDGNGGSLFFKEIIYTYIELTHPNEFTSEIDMGSVRLYPEIGGKTASLGSLDEIIEICKRCNRLHQGKRIYFIFTLWQKPKRFYKSRLIRPRMA